MSPPNDMILKMSFKLRNPIKKGERSKALHLQFKHNQTRLTCVCVPPVRSHFGISTVNSKKNELCSRLPHPHDYCRHLNFLSLLLICLSLTLLWIFLTHCLWCVHPNTVFIEPISRLCITVSNDNDGMSPSIALCLLYLGSRVAFPWETHTTCSPLLCVCVRARVRERERERERESSRLFSSIVIFFNSNRPGSQRCEIPGKSFFRDGLHNTIEQYIRYIVGVCVCVCVTRRDSRVYSCVFHLNERETERSRVLSSVVFSFLILKSKKRGVGENGRGPVSWHPQTPSIVSDLYQINIGVSEGVLLEILKITGTSIRVSSVCQVMRPVWSEVDKHTYRFESVLWYVWVHACVSVMTCVDSSLHSPLYEDFSKVWWGTRQL